MNSFGRIFRVTVFGESHGEALGVVMDGVPAGMALSAADFEADLARRRSGGGQLPAGGVSVTGVSGTVGVTARRESDTPEIVSGVWRGVTTGAPLTVLFRNEDVRSEDYARFADQPRPSHADFTAARKFGGHNDLRGGGHFSGRVTLGLVAAGVVAKKILERVGVDGGGDGGRGCGNYSKDYRGKGCGGVRVSSRIVEIGGNSDAAVFEDIITAAMRKGDSVGGIVECRAEGVPVGWGEPFFDSVESVAAHLLFSIPGVKGVEFGSGFAGSARLGSENNDPIVDARGTTATNHAGGVVGGITNGNEIVVRVAVKPTSSIAREQQTWNFATGRVEPLSVGGRHDACIALRAGVVCEAALAIALADLSRQA